MSTYYGQVIGSAETVASRRGTSKSGIRASAQSWDGSVIVVMRKGRVEIEISNGSDAYGYTEFSGTIDELKTALRNWNARGGR